MLCLVPSIRLCLVPSAAEKVDRLGWFCHAYLIRAATKDSVKLDYLAAIDAYLLGARHSNTAYTADTAVAVDDFRESVY